MECLDATGAVRITRRATPARVSKRQGRVTVATTAADADGKSEAEKERDVPSANVRVFDILRELDGIMVGANNAALNGVRAFVNKCKWDPSRAAAAATAEEGVLIPSRLNVAAIANGGSDALDLAPSIASVLEDAGHLAVVWTAATCPSSAHAIGSAISQLVDSASAMDAQDTVADRNGEENGYRRQYGTASKRRRQAVEQEAAEADEETRPAIETSPAESSRSCLRGVSMDDDGRILLKKRNNTLTDRRVDGPCLPEQLTKWYEAYTRRKSKSGSGKAICFVYEAAECFEPTALEGTLRVLANISSAIPVVAVLCLATAVSAIPAMLPSALAERLAVKTFRLDTARERLGILVDRLLISKEVPAIIFGPRVCALLEEYILHYDYSALALQRALHLAMVAQNDCETDRCALTPALVQSLSLPKIVEAIRGLSATQRRDLRPNLAHGERSEAAVGVEGSHSVVDLAKRLQQSCGVFAREWIGWATAIRILHVTLRAPEISGSEIGQEYPLWRIWALVSQATCAGAAADDHDGDGDGPALTELSRNANKRLKYLISKMMGLLRRLDETALKIIMRKWLEELNGVSVMARFENKICKKLNEMTNRRTQQKSIGREASESGSAADGNPQSEAPSTAAPAAASRQLQASLQGFAHKKSPISAGAAVIRGTGTNARRRRELLHQHVGNIASASTQIRPQDKMRDALEVSLGQWMSEELALILENLRSPLRSGNFINSSLGFDDADAIRSMLLPDPRTSVLEALSRPLKHLDCHCCKWSEGMLTKTMEDACIAYGILNGETESYNLVDWYVEFCRVYGDKAVGNVAVPGSKRKARRASPAHAQEELQARFARAVSELQLLGLFKAGKRSSENVRRQIFASTVAVEDMSF